MSKPSSRSQAISELLGSEEWRYVESVLIAHCERLRSAILSCPDEGKDTVYTKIVSFRAIRDLLRAVHQEAGAEFSSPLKAVFS
jgi:hypothetical protein